MAQSRAARGNSAQTQQRILDASKRLFSERGYEGASLRAIADAAGVNLAAAHYHFGSKEKLLEAAFARCMTPINEERMRRLDLLEAQDANPTVEAIVRAFVEPGLELEGDDDLPRLVARIFAEPRSLSIPLLQKTFSAVADRYLATLARALPDVPADALRWRFHFTIGSMIQLVHFDRPLGLLGDQPGGGSSGAGAGLDHLVQFVTAGMRHDLMVEDPS